MNLVLRILIFSIMIMMLSQCHRKGMPQAPDAPVLPEEPDSIVQIDTFIIDSVIVDIEPQEPDTILFYKRSGCFGNCPVFDLLLLDDSTLVYHGIRHVEHQGIFKRLANQNEFQTVASLSKDYRLDQLAIRYPQKLEEWIPDLPSTTTIYKTSQSQGIIYHNHSGPNNLIQFEKRIEAWIQSINWNGLDK